MTITGNDSGSRKTINCQRKNCILLQQSFRWQGYKTQARKIWPAMGPIGSKSTSGIRIRNRLSSKLGWEMRFSNCFALFFLPSEVLNNTPRVQKKYEKKFQNVTIGQTKTSKVPKTSFSQFIKKQSLFC
jgi:hypothetical protein